MLQLPKSLAAFNSEIFVSVFKNEVGALNCDELPLQQGLSYSSYANGNDLSVSILSVVDDNRFIFVKTGLFYSGVIAGCNCADDPTPVDETNEYAEFLFCIDKLNANTTVSVVG